MKFCHIKSLFLLIILYNCFFSNAQHEMSNNNVLELKFELSSTPVMDSILQKNEQSVLINKKNEKENLEFPLFEVDYITGMNDFPHYFKMNFKFWGELQNHFQLYNIDSPIFIEFIVDKSGLASNVFVKQGVSEIINTELIGLIKRAKWQAGEKEGMKVKSKCVLLISKISK